MHSGFGMMMTIERFFESWFCKKMLNRWKIFQFKQFDNFVSEKDMKRILLYRIVMKEINEYLFQDSKCYSYIVINVNID